MLFIFSLKANGGLIEAFPILRYIIPTFAEYDVVLAGFNGVKNFIKVRFVLNPYNF